MKLASFSVRGRQSYGIVEGDGVIDLGSSGRAPDLRSALVDMTALTSAAGKPSLKLADVKLLPPIPNPERILCAGLNYSSHIKETGRETPPHPIIFTRFPSSQVGHGDDMIRPRVSEQFDFEGELAVVIGAHCRHVSKENWQSVVAGYSCYNDGSVRDWQRHSQQFIPGKNFYRSGAFGPFLVTKDEVADITKSTLITRLNGQEVQNAVVSDLLFDIPDLIAYCSTFTPLEPGDVIVTGTTGGVGSARKPPLWMKAGDQVEVEIEGVGKLQNMIVDEE